VSILLTKKFDIFSNRVNENNIRWVLSVE
jgi:hypothetical protein